MSRVLRDYQETICDRVLTEWQTKQSTLVVLYTGGGKTVCFAHLIRRRLPSRSLVIAHREELIFQARDRIEESTGVTCGIEMANYYASTNRFSKPGCVIATVQTLFGRNRISRFDPTDFDTLIIDEAHHATATSYKKVVDYFKQNPNLKILGVTATPHRADKEALGQAFESVADEYDILDGIQDGWLVDITQQFVTVGTLDYSHIKTTAGDLNGAQLAAVMETEQNIAGVCQPSLEVIFGLEPKTLSNVAVPDWNTYLQGLGKVPRRTIVFTASVLQAEALCNIFNRAYSGLAQWVCGKTNKYDRRHYLKRFAAGEVPVMLNCNCLTEGFDLPAVEVIIMARPTKSAALYQQMCGRSTRTLPGTVDGIATAEERVAKIKSSPKPFCRIIDFVGNSGRHKLITCMDILGGKVSDEVRARAIKDAVDGNKPVRVTKAMSNAEHDIQKERIEEARSRRAQEEARKARLVPKSEFGFQKVNPFGWEDSFRNLRPRRHDEPAASEKQVQFILKWCRNFKGDPRKLSKRQAGAIIGKQTAEWSTRRAA